MAIMIGEIDHPCSKGFINAEAVSTLVRRGSDRRDERLYRRWFVELQQQLGGKFHAELPDAIIDNPDNRDDSVVERPRKSRRQFVFTESSPCEPGLDVDVP